MAHSNIHCILVEWISEWQGKEGQFESFCFKQPFSDGFLGAGRELKLQTKKGLHVKKKKTLSLVILYPFSWLTGRNHKKLKEWLSCECHIHISHIKSVPSLSHMKLSSDEFVYSDNFKCTSQDRKLYECKNTMYAILGRGIGILTTGEHMCKVQIAISLCHLLSISLIFSINICWVPTQDNQLFPDCLELSRF